MDATGGQTSTVELAERERQFFNTRAGLYPMLRRLIWRAIGAFNRNDEVYELYDAQGKRLLLYGCGPAEDLRRFIDAGAADVTGIDIADADIERANARAQREGFADRARFMTADAHHTEFADDSFDLIVGAAILHHLEIPLALAELRRILAPGGRAVFIEPLAHNPLLRLGRRLTPAARTADEHPITEADWRLCAEVFPNFQHREAEFVSIPLMPVNLVLPRSLQERLAARVKRIDERLLRRYPRLGKHARITFLILE